MKKKRKDFYTSVKSISRSGYVMKGKIELLMNFKWISKMSIPTVEMFLKEIQSLCNFLSWKLLKLSFQTRFKVFFKRDVFSARKASLSISFTSLIGMEWTKASLVGMDLSKMAQFYFIYKKCIWRSFLCYPPCPSWPSNLKNHITFDLKISYVKKLPRLEAHSIPYSQ
jgi:hypothetical protein